MKRGCQDFHKEFFLQRCFSGETIASCNGIISRSNGWKITQKGLFKKQRMQVYTKGIISKSNGWKMTQKGYSKPITISLIHISSISFMVVSIFWSFHTNFAKKSTPKFISAYKNKFRCCNKDGERAKKKVSVLFFNVYTNILKNLIMLPRSK